MHAVEDDPRRLPFSGHVEPAGTEAESAALPVIGTGAAVLDIEAAGNAGGNATGIEGAVVADDPVILRQPAFDRIDPARGGDVGDRVERCDDHVIGPQVELPRSEEHTSELQSLMRI